jgi:outer membrane protein TolC
VNRIGVIAKLKGTSFSPYIYRSRSEGRAEGLQPLRFLPILLLALTSVPAKAQVSLSTVVALAQRNSSIVKLAKADLQKATATLAETKDVYVPNLVLGSSIGPPSIGFTFSQPSIASASMQSLFFSWPQRQYIKAARQGVEAATLALKDANEQASLEASTEYIELDAVTREVESGQQQSGFADRLLDIEQQRQQAGVDSMSDLLQARLTHAQLKLRILHLQSRAAALIAQIAALTGLPAASIRTEHPSIPEIPAVKADLPSTDPPLETAGVQAARSLAASRNFQAKGDYLQTKHWPLIGFGAQYNRDATSLNNFNLYFSRINPKTGQTERFKADNFSAGFTIQIPVYDISRRDKSDQTAAEALRSTVEAEQAQRQNDVQIASLTGNIRELDAFAEVANLKQQIAGEQLKAVQAQLESGNGAGTDPGAPPQQSPKAEQLAKIDERQKFSESLESGLDLDKARLNLLRALGHMDDWLHELHAKEPQGAPTVP